MRHTKGPWRVVESVNSSEKDFGILAPNCENVLAEAFEHFTKLEESRPEEARANAHLMSASPDLLEACLAAMDSMTMAQQDMTCLRSFKLMDKAVRKARGAEGE